MAKKAPIKTIALITVLTLLVIISSCGTKKLTPEKYLSFGENGSYSVNWEKLTKDLGGSRKVYRFFEERYPLLMPDTVTPDTMSASWLFDIYTGYSEPKDDDTYLQYYTFRAHWFQMDAAEIEEYFGIRLEAYIRKEHY